MRLFYDLYSGRGRAESLLFFSDAIVVSSAVLYVTGALERKSSPWDVAFLILWASVPHALSKARMRSEKLFGWMRSTPGSAALIAMIAVLFLAGWELLESTSSANTPAELGAQTALLFLWVSGFLLIEPRAYRLHDFLVLTAMLLGLRAGRPLPFLWLPLFFAGFHMSCALRHVLFDALKERQRQPVNLQNARMVAVLTTIAAVAILAPGFFISDFHKEKRRARDAEQLSRSDADAGYGEYSGGNPAAARSGGGIPGARLDGTSESDSSSSSSAGAGIRRLGYNCRVGLRDLTFAHRDPREVLRIEVKREDPDAEPWQPPADWLWKAATLSAYDPASDTWIQETHWDEEAWPKNGKLARSGEIPELGGASVLLRNEVLLPVSKSMILPYVTIEVESKELTRSRVNPMGDIIPSPPISKAAVYFTRVIPLQVDALPQVAARGVNPDQRYLRLPAEKSVASDMKEIAGRIFHGKNLPIQEKVAQLHEYFSKRLRYAQTGAWRGGKQPLRDFLEKDNVGDCSYFATASALLLRAGGVSTRFAVGFVGGKWDEKNHATVLKNQDAHAWTEVFVPGSGWYSLDPTRWVDPDPSYVPPPDEALDGGLLAEAGPEKSAPAADSPASADDSGLPDGMSSSEKASLKEAGALKPASALGPSRERRAAANRKGRLARGGAGDDDDASWIGYGSFFPGGAGNESDEVLGGAQDGDPALGPGAKRRPRLARFAPILRSLLILSAVCVCVFFILSRLKEKQEKADDKSPLAEEGSGAAAGDSSPHAAFAAGTDPTSRVVMEYVRLQEALERTRRHRRAHETPVEHARKTIKSGADETEEAFNELHRILYRVVYGGEAAEEKHVQAAKRKLEAHPKAPRIRSFKRKMPKTLKQIESWVESFTAELAPREKALAEAWWKANTTGGKKEEEEAARSEEAYRLLFASPERCRELKELAADFQPRGTQAATPEYKRLLRQLFILGNEFEMNRMDPATIREIVTRIVEIESQFNNFRAALRGERVADNRLREVLRASDDPDLTREAWLASKQIGSHVAPKVLELVKIRNEAARKSGYPNFQVMSLQLNELEPERLFSLLDRLKEITTAPFLAMKEKLDLLLAQRFKVDAGELRPWHYGDPFFQSAPRSASLDLDSFYKDKNLERLTLKFFDGLGLDIRDLLEKSDLYERDGKCQHAFCTDIDRNGDVRVLCNLKPTEHWMGTLLHEFGHAVYDKYRDADLPHILRGPTHTFTTEAIAMLFGRLSQSTELLTAIAGADPAEAAKVAHDARALFRQNQLIFIRWALVVVYFERELYQNPDQDLASVWWGLVRDLQGLTGPGGKNPDWASKIHIGTSPIYYQNYILGELLASQLSHYMLKVRLPGSRTLVNQPRVGEFLVDSIFRPGRTLPWYELVEKATGEELNPGYFLADCALK